MVFEILFAVVLIYALFLSIWVIKRTVGTFTITMKSDGSLSGRMEMGEDIDELAKHRTMICNVKLVRE